MKNVVKSWKDYLWYTGRQNVWSGWSVYEVICPFFYVKNWPNLYEFFSLKNMKMEEQLLFLASFENFDFKCTSFSKNVSKF